MTVNLRLTSCFLFALHAVCTSSAPAADTRIDGREPVAASSAEKESKENVAETVTFLLKGQKQTVRGRTVVEAAASLSASLIREDSLTVNGQVTINTSGGTSHLNALDISGSTDNWDGVLDLKNNSLVLEAGNLALITNQIKSGLYQGTGITSSAPGNPFRLGSMSNKNGGGAIMDFGCYGAEWAVWLKGRPKGVQATAQRFKVSQHNKVDDDATILLEYPDAMVIIEASWNWPHSMGQVQVFGPKGSFLATRSKLFYRPTEDRAKTGLEGEPIALNAPQGATSNPVAYFVDCIRRDKPIEDPLSARLNVQVMEILDAARRVTDHLNVPFNSVGLNLYRDGRDSVAPHNDHLNELVKGFPIALISLGATRRMTVRVKMQPRRVLHVDLESGSLFVMDYATQIHYTHGVPKTTEHVGERISLAFRMKRAAVSTQDSKSDFYQ